MDSFYNSWEVNPISLFTYCLGDEGPGSILAYLKSLGLANGLNASRQYNIPEFGMLSVDISLTPSGLEKWQDIVCIVYSYIYQMSKLTEKEWKNYFDERCKVRQMNFDYKGKEKPYFYSKSIVRSMQKYPIKTLFKSIAGIASKFDVNIILKYFKQITVENCYYQLLSKTFENECKNEEEWYQTKYNCEKIDKKVLSNWNDYLAGKSVFKNDTSETKEKDNDNNNNNKQGPLYTPPLNPYIADNFDIFCEKLSTHCFYCCFVLFSFVFVC